MLCNGHSDSCDIDFLEGIQTKQTAGNVTCNSNQRNGIHVCSCNTGYKIGGAGTGGSQNHAGLSGGTCVAVSRMTCALLVACDHMLDFVAVLVQTVVNIENSTAGIAKNSIRALFQ